MTKKEYLDNLLVNLTENNVPNIDAMVEFYSELIDDRIEDGMTEEEAVAAMDDVDTVVGEAVVEKPITTLVKDKIKKNHDEAKKKGHGALWTTLVILGFPVWFPVLFTFFTLIFTLFIVLWAVVVTLYAVNFSLAVTSIAVFIGGFAFLFGQITFTGGLCMWAAALIIGGLFLIFMTPIIALAKGMVKLIKFTLRKIKGILI